MITPGAGVSAGDLDCELGTGDLSFVPFEAGAQVPYFEGPQGGWHTFGSLRVKGIPPGDPEDLTDPETPLLRFQVLRDGALYAGVDYQQPRGLTDAGGGWFERVGEQLVLNIGERMEADGVDVEFTFELTGADGSVLSSSLPATLYFLQTDDTGDTGEPSGDDTASAGTK